jgi:hypothetical protein
MLGATFTESAALAYSFRPHENWLMAAVHTVCLGRANELANWRWC